MKILGFCMMLFGFLLTTQGTSWNALMLMAGGCALIYGAYRLEKR
jgi:hypothetical protein